jgi:hypothetical protein
MRKRSEYFYTFRIIADLSTDILQMMSIILQIPKDGDNRELQITRTLRLFGHEINITRAVINMAENERWQ